MIDRTHGLSVSRQAKLLNISRGAVYYLPKPTSDRDLALMNAIDGLHLDFPFMGSRQLCWALVRQGYQVRSGSVDLNRHTPIDKCDGIDKILLDDAIFKKLIGDADFSDNFYVRTILGPPTTQDQNDFIVFDLESSKLYYDPDGNGQRSPAVWFAKLPGVSGLSHDDFSIV
jgi:hypothetical protein